MCEYLLGLLGHGGSRYSPPLVDRIWFWVYYDEIPIYPIFYLLKGDYNPRLWIRLAELTFKV